MPFFPPVGRRVKTTYSLTGLSFWRCVHRPSHVPAIAGARIELEFSRSVQPLGADRDELPLLHPAGIRSRLRCQHPADKKAEMYKVKSE